MTAVKYTSITKVLRIPNRQLISQTQANEKGSYEEKWLDKDTDTLHIVPRNLFY